MGNKFKGLEKARKKWAELNPKILKAIKNDEQPDVFQELLVEVHGCFKKLKKSSAFDEMSVTLQRDA